MHDGVIAGDNVKLTAPSFREMNAACESLAKADLGDTRELACLLSKMNLRYYSDVLNQAKASFVCALVAAGLGVSFFISAATLVMRNRGDKAWVSLIAGAVVQVISGTCFYLYQKASGQFATFHICLDRSNRFVLANALCEKLAAPARDETRAFLIHEIAEATLLTPDVVSGSRSTARERKGQRIHQHAASNGTQPPSSTPS